MRRLADVEIENVVTDLVGQPLGVTRGFYRDDGVGGYDNNAAHLGIGGTELDQLVGVAERVAAHVTKDATNLARFAPCPAGTAQGTCAHDFITTFAAKAWGRTPSDDEVARLGVVFDAGDGATDFRAGIALTVQAIVLSPHFLYATELGGAPAAGTVTLAGHEIASSLALLVRGARPDAALLDAGLKGALVDPAMRAAHATRLLGEPGGRRQIERFVRGWLGLDDVGVINKDLAIFPGFTPAVRAALDREVTTFIDHVLTDAGGKLDELFLADYTFPGPALAPIYGDDLSGSIGSFTKVGLDANRRRGILSSPAFLARHANIGMTNPVERGLMIRARLFCQDMPGPPASVAAVTPTGGPETTTRMKYEAHSKDPFCQTCHRMMDPLGFGLEQFDAIGRFRTIEGDNNPIDARGKIVGTDVDGNFVGPADLAPRLVASAQFRACAVKQMFQFAYGRLVDDKGRDDAELAYLSATFDDHGDTLPGLIAAIVSQPGFILREVPAPEAMP